jgi:tetratricopeptide (TPR) repeat protein
MGHHVAPSGGVVVLLAAALLTVPAGADPAPDTAEEAALKVLAAIAAGDAAALKELASRDDPDPWYVADELLFRGDPAAAAAFARAAPRKDVEALPAWIDRRRGAACDRGAREALVAIQALSDEGKFKEALAALDGVRCEDDEIARIRIQFLRSSVLRDLGRDGESADAAESVAEPCRRLGWLLGETRAVANVGISARAGGDTERALAACARQRALSEARGSRKSLLQAHVNTGQTYAYANRLEEAFSAFDQADAIARELGDLGSLGWSMHHRASLRLRRGEKRRALEGFAQALDAFESASDWWGAGLAGCRGGSLATDLIEFDTAIPLYERGIAAKLRSPRERDRLDLFIHYRMLGLALREVGRLDDALDRSMLALQRAEKIGSVGDAAGTLALIGNLHGERGSPDVAAVFHRRAIEAVERTGGPLAMSRVFLLVGMHEYTWGSMDAARTLLERALRAGEEAGSVEDQVRALGLLMYVRDNLRDRDGALLAAERALALGRTLSDRGEMLAVLCLVARTHVSAGDIAKGLSAAREALELAQETGGGQRTVFALGGLAEAFARSGEQRLAIGLLERYIGLSEGRSKDPQLALTLLFKAKLELAIGERKALQESVARAQAIFASRSDGPARWTRALLELAKLAPHLGWSAERRLELLDRISEACLSGGYPLHRATALALVARVRAERGEFAQAIECAQRALELAGGRAPVTEAEALESLAETSEMQGDFDRAFGFADGAVAAYQRAGEHLMAVRAGIRVARVCARMERWREATEAAVATVERLGLVMGRLSEESGLDALAGMEPLFSWGARAADRAGDTERTAFFREAGRAGLLRDGLALRDAAAAAALPPDLIVDERVCRSRVATALGALRRAEESADPAAHEAARKEAEAARSSWREAIGRAQQFSRIASSVAFPRPDGLGEIRGRLRPSETLLLYATPGAEVTEATVLVVTRESARVVPLGPTADVEAACAAFDASRSGADPTDAAAALERLVIAPLGLDPKVTRLLVSPDGALSYIPFGLVSGGREVVFVPSGTIYGALLGEAAKRGEGVLALGDPDYGVRPPPDLLVRSEALRSGMDLLPLAAAAEEARSVGTTVLLGKSATRRALAEALATRPRWRAVHFACHGVVDTEWPAMTALALAADEASDGLLTALDVTRLRVPADLVVLSACETGRGKVCRAEGIVGLTRAFMVAGAPRVLASLWKVDDAATLAFMKAFYASWNGGRSPAAALRDAQAAVRSQPKWSHPRYWAAWVLWGLGD